MVRIDDVPSLQSIWEHMIASFLLLDNSDTLFTPSLRQFGLDVFIEGSFGITAFRIKLPRRSRWKGTDARLILPSFRLGSFR
mmetsp:Transcript_560/g.1501  ORF Transcript_560/g.1501 Transcript_560/m.1501 type:complete len:82 (-) Transcript_560:216-461(-)